MTEKNQDRKLRKLSSMSFLGALKPKINKARKSLSKKMEQQPSRLQSSFIGPRLADS